METAKILRRIRGRETSNSTRRQGRAIIVAMLVLSIVLVAFSGRSLAATETVLYSFQGGTDGNSPQSGLLRAPNGVLYGTTAAGGGSGCPLQVGCGTVFSLTPPTALGAAWTEVIIHDFLFSIGGEAPVSNLIFGPNGTLLGTTSLGGASDRMGLGTIFKLTRPSTQGGTWSYSVQHSFPSFTNDGASPTTGLLATKSGFYGATMSGGASGSGTVFQLVPPATAGAAWTESALYSFTGGSDGGMPASNLAVGSDGTLYGTASVGGQFFPSGSSCGTVFALTPLSNSGGAWAESTLFTFNFADGCTPFDSPLVIGRDGTLHGTTFGGGTPACPAGGPGCGNVFALTPPATTGGTWTETVIHTFAGPIFNTDGSNPLGGLLAGANGALFGTTNSGGNTAGQCNDIDTGGCGTVFELTPPPTTGGIWTETILHNFSTSVQPPDGLLPQGNLTADKNGTLYGTTPGGGVFGQGTVFSVTP